MAADRDDLERIRQAINVAELFESVTTVRKVRGRIKALCPFHTEKTPSLSIDPTRGLYHCFGCGVGGDIFTFVQETQGLSFNEAVEILAERAGVTIRRDPGAARRRERRSRLLEAVAEAGRFYHARLKSASDAGHARAYVRKMKYGTEVVDRFELGYSPEEPDALVSHLRGHRFDDRDMVAAGLGRRGQRGRLIDQMRGRLMFPIHNVRGEMVGFGARLLRGDGPKYLNTPETPLYKKSELLYGLDKARTTISREELAVVVEGYTDVIAFHLAGRPIAVASCGTALGEAHFDLLRRFSSRIVLAFDADTAGANAAVRGDELRITTELDLDLRVALLPEGRDPADLVLDDKGDLLGESVGNSVPITEFRINRLLGSYNLNEREARSRAMREAAQVIARHPDPAARDLHARYVAGITRMKAETVQAEIQKKLPKGSGTRRRPYLDGEQHSASAQALQAVDNMDRVERDLLRHLLAGSAKRDRLQPDLFDDEQAAALVSYLLEAGQHLAEGAGVAIDEIKDPNLSAMAYRIAVLDTPYPPFQELFAHVIARDRGRRKNQLLMMLEDIDKEKDPQAYSKILDKLIILQKEES